MAVSVLNMAAGSPNMAISSGAKAESSMEAQQVMQNSGDHEVASAAKSYSSGAVDSILNSFKSVQSAIDDALEKIVSLT